MGEPRIASRKEKEPLPATAGSLELRIGRCEGAARAAVEENSTIARSMGPVKSSACAPAVPPQLNAIPRAEPSPDPPMLHVSLAARLRGTPRRRAEPQPRQV